MILFIVVIVIFYFLFLFFIFLTIIVIVIDTVILDTAHYGICKYYWQPDKPSIYNGYGQYVYHPDFMTKCECLNLDSSAKKDGTVNPYKGRFWKDTLGLDVNNYYNW